MNIMLRVMGGMPVGYAFGMESEGIVFTQYFAGIAIFHIMWNWQPDKILLKIWIHNGVCVPSVRFKVLLNNMYQHDTWTGKNWNRSNASWIVMHSPAKCNHDRKSEKSVGGNGNFINRLHTVNGRNSFHQSPSSCFFVCVLDASLPRWGCKVTKNG